MLALRSYEKKNKDGFAAMNADELKFINGGESSGKYGGPIGPKGPIGSKGPNKKK